jgi:hypothetical protein
VEMLAVMAKYNPFAEKAGMRKITEQPPSKEALKIAETLAQLGFNIHLLGSEKYVLTKLQTLNAESITKIKEAFIKHPHARFMKYFFCYIPFGRKEAYAKEVVKANLEKLASLIKVCGFLIQTKVYLFWQKKKGEFAGDISIRCCFGFKSRPEHQFTGNFYIFASLFIFWCLFEG